ncbi:hypothetical protein DPMN_168730 [Dreissena polymorpha]|uniref:Uncharacterized protein n=1 Tax=Dreissena polymorpha TaxID=45954 RepID=A0A9D4F3X1_DREPO|nr:hypothetical protein DPMN_168730 [Dreissena polymorpha]
MRKYDGDNARYDGDNAIYDGDNAIYDDDNATVRQYDGDSAILRSRLVLLINEGFYGNTIHTSNVQSSVSDVNQFAEPKLPKTMKGKTGQHNMGPTNADISAMLGTIDLKLNDMDSRLKTLEGLEKN